MSVSKSGPVSIIPWRSGVLNPAYPAARWTAGSTITGDVSGGVIFTDFVLEANDKRTQRLFSIEGINAHENAEVASLSLMVSLVQFDVININQISWRKTKLLEGVGANAAFTALSLLKEDLGFPFQHLPGGDMVLSLLLDPNANGNTFTMSAWGWIWEAEAFRTPTGPQKPW